MELIIQHLNGKQITFGCKIKNLTWERNVMWLRVILTKLWKVSSSNFGGSHKISGQIAHMFSTTGGKWSSENLVIEKALICLEFLKLIYLQGVQSQTSLCFFALSIYSIIQMLKVVTWCFSNFLLLYVSKGTQFLLSYWFATLWISTSLMTTFFLKMFSNFVLRTLLTYLL